MNHQHLIVTILFSLILRAKAFSYKEAKNWGKQYSGCKGKLQSPININSSFNNPHPNISEPLKFTDFKKLPTRMTIQNTVHTVEMKADWSGEPPRVTGGPLHGKYVFEKTTFHWAQKQWTEDITDATPAYKYQILKDMEMHLFFYKTDFKSFEKAESEKEGLAVFKAWFTTAEPLLNQGESPINDLVDTLEKNLNKVKSIKSKAEIPPFPLASFVAEGMNFVFYEGSLDYPPCSESVTWFICDTIIVITDNLIKKFRKIKLAAGDKSNVRPIQALNKREVKLVYNQPIQEM